MSGLTENIPEMTININFKKIKINRNNANNRMSEKRQRQN